MMKTGPTPTTCRDRQDITALLNRDIVKMEAVETKEDVGIVVTYGDGEMVYLPLAGGCGCCGSPYLIDEEHP
jgi:hypothetical protein